MDGFIKRVLSIPEDELFDEAYYTYCLYMFFKESRESEEDIKRMFNHIRELKKRDAKLTKKGDPEKFVVPRTVAGHVYQNALYDTGTSVSIIPKAMEDYLGEPSRDSFALFDCSKVNSGGLIRDQEVVFGNSVNLVYFHVMDITKGWNTSLLLL